MDDRLKDSAGQILGLAAPTLGGFAGSEALHSLLLDDLPRYNTSQVARLRELMKLPTSELPVLEIGSKSNTGFYAPRDSSKPVIDRLRMLLSDKDLDFVRDVDTGSKLTAGRLKELASSAAKSKGVVVIGDEAASAATLAHEMGHATMSQKGLVKALRRLNSNVGLLSKSPGVSLALHGVGMSPVFMDKDNPYLMAPAAVVGASQVPLLLEEGTATAKGLSALKKMVREKSFSQDAYRSARRHLAKAFGTYAAPAIGLAAMPALIAAAKKNYG